MYEQVAEKLLQFPLFADYDLESLRWLADPQRYVYVKQGEIILHQDSSPERCHILIEGTASVKKRTEEYDIPIIVLHPGSFCGEISVMTDAPTAAQVQALEDSMLICLEKDDFFHMLSKYPSLERKLMRMLNEQVRNMENATWYRERESFLKLEHDVQTAKQIQHSFLPDSIAQPEGWHICSRFHPAREVAGDFYDCFLMSQGRRIGLIIADVCDKGIGAALFMALSRSLLRAYIEQNQFISRSLVDLLIMIAVYRPANVACMIPCQPNSLWGQPNC
ncbi:MAG: cyclic nucleotide-binding domain-containing protein [Chloroflexaceae bacterium]|nr:cyclic nucleotide-binding domain-containing protein [Chloroflexaceae bacterium]